MKDLEYDIDLFLDTTTYMFPGYSRNWFNTAIKHYHKHHKALPNETDVELVRLCLLNSRNIEKTKNLLELHNFDEVLKISRYWYGEQRDLSDDVFCIDTYGKIYTSSHQVFLSEEEPIQFSFVNLSPKTRLPVWSHDCLFDFNCHANRTIIIEKECSLNNVDISHSGIKRLECMISGILKANNTKKLEYINPDIIFHDDVFLKYSGLKRYENTTLGDFTGAYSDIEYIKPGITFHKSCYLNNCPISEFRCHVHETLDITGTKIEHPDARFKIGTVVKK